MKHNYTNTAKQLLLAVLLLVGTLGYSQNIKFTFENAMNTNDGTNDFYEADVMIGTIDGQADFKLGSGQIYFNYNEAAFGPNVQANGNFTVTQPNGDLDLPLSNGGGYICGQGVDATAAAAIYGGFVVNDNTTFRVSWAFTQVFGSSTFALNNVLATPRRLIHIKIKYVDVNAAPMVAFENDNNVLSQATDQFYTACGDAGGAFASVDCTNYPGTQFVGATFDSAGATLAVEQNQLLQSSVSIYPNPATNVINVKASVAIKSIKLFDMLGKQVLVTNQTEQINIKHLPIGVYFLKAFAEDGSITKKIVIE